MTWVVCPPSNLVSCSQKCRKLVGGREKQKAMCRLISRVGKRWNSSQWAVCFNHWTKVWLPFIAPLRPLAKWAQQYLGSEPWDVCVMLLQSWVVFSVFQYVDLYQAHINAPALIVGNMGTMMGHLPGFVSVTLSLSDKGTDGSSSLHPWSHLDSTWQWVCQ